MIRVGQLSEIDAIAEILGGLDILLRHSDWHGLISVAVDDDLFDPEGQHFDGGEVPVHVGVARSVGHQVVHSMVAELRTLRGGQIGDRS